MATGADDPAWLAQFHAGDKRTLGRAYEEHFDSVHGAVSRVLPSVDAETVTHEVFFRMVSEVDFRKRFEGGSLRAWLVTVAKNRAIDVLRRQRREEHLEPEAFERAVGAGQDHENAAERFAERSKARAIVERFRREQLPPKWAPVFEARFMKQLSQREAASELGLSRTTLAYQELRIRALLERFLLDATEAKR